MEEKLMVRQQQRSNAEENDMKPAHTLKGSDIENEEGITDKSLPSPPAERKQKGREKADPNEKVSRHKLTATGGSSSPGVGVKCAKNGPSLPTPSKDTGNVNNILKVQ